MSKYIINTKKITKAYKNQKANNEVSINIEEGSIYGLLGPNGAGKSTLLKMLAGLARPTSGEIVYQDAPWKREDILDIGALIEHPAIYPNLTAWENLEVYRLMYNISNKQSISKVLETVRLTNTGKKRAKKFSMGMKQRLGLAISLLKEPRLLILDEPTNGLDPVGIEELRELIRSFPEQGITVLLSSHNLSEVQQVATHIGILHQGNLLYEAPIDPNEDLESRFKEIIRQGGPIHA
ncbi:lantibiotic protection ABC transporter ATP-binding subunit [Sporosarcina sp. BP05]|uniref:lantibiotic protection ABC transporter ATP-binding subunit n=1 Tax=Sporosarcina sp. BP05 TaxID=2758726 RepID=UPI001644E2BB|nr:lantibiotic protection ABC transporter ATP-binding subunit [Sporosarcina sp. BP05]